MGVDARAQQRDHGPVVLGRASQTPRSAPPASGGRRAPAAGQSAAVGRGRERDVWLGYWAGCVGLSGPKGGGFGSIPFPDSKLLAIYSKKMLAISCGNPEQRYYCQ